MRKEERELRIKGVGKGNLNKCTGLVNVDVETHGKSMKKSQILLVREHKYRVILGKSFLVENRVAVNAPRKWISVISEDENRDDLYLKGPFCCQRVVSRALCTLLRH